MKRMVLLIAALAGALCLYVNQLEQGAEGKARLEEALRRTALTGYVCDGQYPASVAEMQEKYGLRYDESRYVVRYELIASNLMPSITVLEVGK